MATNPHLSSPLLARAIRNAAVIRWFEAGMPGTRNSLLDIVMGYASYHGIPWEEIDMDGIQYDSDVIEFTWVRYGHLVSDSEL